MYSDPLDNVEAAIARNVKKIIDEKDLEITQLKKDINDLNNEIKVYQQIVLKIKDLEIKKKIINFIRVGE